MKKKFAFNMKKKRSSQALSEPVIAVRKKKRICVKSFQPQRQPFSSTEPEFHLPDDCWEHVFSFIVNSVDEIEDKNKLYFKSSLSLVSKQFLSITNRLIFSLTIYYPQLCFLPRFFHRFSNLHSLDLWFASSHHLDDNAAIALTLRDRSTLKSLSIFGIDLKEPNYLTSHYIDSFMSLKGLNSLTFRYSKISDDLLYSIARGLPLKSFVLENCMGYSYHGIYDLLSNCRGIRDLGLQDDDFLNNHHVSQLSLLLPDLLSINLSGCSKLTNSALFAFIKNCCSLAKITMESIYTTESQRQSIQISDFDVNPQLKFLHLRSNSLINDDTLILLASVFPNLQFLYLRFCDNISKISINKVLSRCCKLKHLDLSFTYNMRGLKMNFVVHQLEVLDLSFSNVNDKTLYQISKSCCGLLELLLIMCDHVTEKGVMLVVENCTQLKEIYLKWCRRVNLDVVVSMLSSRPSLHVFSSSYRHMWCEKVNANVAVSLISSTPSFSML